MRQELVSGNLDVSRSWWTDNEAYHKWAEARLAELRPVFAIVRGWCGQRAAEELQEVIALRQEVDLRRILFGVIGEDVDIGAPLDLRVRVEFGLRSEGDCRIARKIGRCCPDVEVTAAVGGTFPVTAFTRCTGVIRFTATVRYFTSAWQRPRNSVSASRKRDIGSTTATPAGSRCT